MSNFSTIYPAGDNLIINSTYAYNSQPYTPFVLWIVVIAAALAFLILCFAYSMRDQNGRVSPQRLLFSILATITNGIAALISINIAVPSSVAETITDLGSGSTLLVVVQNYTVYTQLEIVILFVVFGVLALANIVYTLNQPELIKPDIDEIGGNSSSIMGGSKIKAQRGKKEEDDGEDT
jgi:hypothetical protein